MAGIVGSGGTPPGTVDPFSQEALGQAEDNAATAMVNRYNQLGVMRPGSSPQAAAAGHTNIQSAGPSTPLLQDLGQAPSLVGGIPAQFAAAFGEMQNNALSAGNTGSTGKGGGGGLGGLGSIAGLAGK